MNTRSRKRKREKRLRENTKPVVELEDILVEAKSAILPECSTHNQSEMGENSPSPETSSTYSEPRHFSSCSRLARSPSPARLCRQREHTELQVLNERLSSHAESVKQLQAENARLRLQVVAMDDVIQRESRNMKQLHGSEIKTLQELIDKCNEEKASVSSLYEEEKIERERLSAVLWDKDAEIVLLCEQLDALKTVSEEYRKLKVELEATEVALTESRQDAERMSAELLKEKRCNRRLEEEASANKERYLKEVEETSHRFSEHMQQADQKLEEGYEAMVTSALTCLRQQHIRDLEGLRAEMTTNYQSKISEWKSACELAQADLLTARREAKVTRQEQDRLRDMVTHLKAEKAALEVQLSETHARLEEVRDHAERDRCQAQREVALLKQELAEQREELEEMGGANSRLEAEINAYRLIVEDLEGQKQNSLTLKGMTRSENDQGVSTFKSQERKQIKTSGLATKSESSAFDIFQKKDYIRTNDYSQGIEILDIDIEGRYIILINTTDHPTDLCLWTVQQTDGFHTVKYELGVSTQLARGKKLKLWSCDQEASNAEELSQMYGSSVEDDADDDVQCLESNLEDEETDGDIDLRMPGKTWLRLNQKLTVRVEDGDGQLQAKCDISTISDNVSTKTDNDNTTTSATSTCPLSTAWAITDTNFTTTTTSSSSSRSSTVKRPRLGGFYRSVSSSSNLGVGSSSSETRFNNYFNSGSGVSVSPSVTAWDGLGLTSTDTSRAPVGDGPTGLTADRKSYLFSPFQTRPHQHGHDKDSCLIM